MKYIYILVAENLGPTTRPYDAGLGYFSTRDLAETAAKESVGKCHGHSTIYKQDLKIKRVRLNQLIGVYEE